MTINCKPYWTKIVPALRVRTLPEIRGLVKAGRLGQSATIRSRQVTEGLRDMPLSR